MRYFVIAAALLVPCTTLASSDDAWNDLAKTAKAACTVEIKKDKNITAVSVGGTVLGIGGKNDDQFYALVLKGNAKAYSTQYLCLYDKVAKTATASEVTAP